MEKTFAIEGLKITITGENLPGDVIETAKEAAKNHWEFGSVKRSIPYINKINALEEITEKAKIGLVEFFVLKINLRKERQTDFGEYDVSASRQFEESLEDDIGQRHKVTITIGDTDIEEKTLMTNLEAYRKLRFTDSELTTRTLRLFLVQEQQRGGGVYFSDVEELKAYIAKLDLQRDLPAVHELVGALNAATEKFGEKFVTDIGEKLLEALLLDFSEAQAGYEKAAADPPSPDGPFMGEYNENLALAGTVNRLADAAYDTAQRMTQEKGEGFFSALKAKLSSGKGLVLFPDDIEKKVTEARLS